MSTMDNVIDQTLCDHDPALFQLEQINELYQKMEQLRMEMLFFEKDAIDNGFDIVARKNKLNTFGSENGGHVKK